MFLPPGHRWQMYYPVSAGPPLFTQASRKLHRHLQAGPFPPSDEPLVLLGDHPQTSDLCSPSSQLPQLSLPGEKKHCRYFRTSLQNTSSLHLPLTSQSAPRPGWRIGLKRQQKQLMTIHERIRNHAWHVALGHFCTRALLSVSDGERGLQAGWNHQAG